MPKAHRAILIDAHTQKVREVQVSGLEDYYREMQVSLITTGCWMDSKTVLYVDDEGLINGTTVGFSINGRPYAGSGLITAVSRKTGNSINLTDEWTAEGVARKVEFFFV